MPNPNSPVYTDTLSSALTINSDDMAMAVTVKVLTGTLDVVGNAKFRNNASTPVTLSAGQGFTYTAKENAPIEGLTLMPTGNTALIITF